MVRTVADTPQRWPVVASEHLHRDDWVIALRQDLLRRPGHPEEEPFRRLVLEAPGAAVILALDDGDRVFCLQQYRHPVEHALVELPAGLLDVAGEAPLEVAVRELREEAGLRAEQWTLLAATYPSPGISSEIHHLFLARGLSETDRSDFEPEHEEAEMASFWVPFDELRRAVVEGRVADAPVALAVLLCEARGLGPAGRALE
jgi:ADP-ribose pyrophosphatase